MCRLFGLLANQPVDVEFALVSSAKPFQSFGQKHPSGWGMGWYQDDTPSITKEPLPAHESDAIVRAATDVYSNLTIAHVRFATCGELTRENCHPFGFGKWLFAHNGGLNRNTLLERLDERHIAALEGQTDSEVFFHWILQNIERAGEVPAGLRASLSAVQDYSGLNFLLTDGQSLYAYRDASKRHDYYSLFALKRDPIDGQLERFKSIEVGTLLHSKSL